MSDRFDFSPGTMAQVSGGVRFDPIRALAGMGGDRICTDTPTQNVKAADIAMRPKEIR